MSLCTMLYVSQSMFHCRGSSEWNLYISAEEMDKELASEVPLSSFHPTAAQSRPGSAGCSKSASWTSGLSGPKPPWGTAPWMERSSCLEGPFLLPVMSLCFIILCPGTLPGQTQNLGLWPYSLSVCGPRQASKTLLLPSPSAPVLQHTDSLAEAMHLVTCSQGWECLTSISPIEEQQQVLNKTQWAGSELP